MEMFEIGKTYQTRSPGDAECVIRITVARRSAKTVTTTDGKRFGITTWSGVETIRPWGKYSMAPTMGADRCVSGRA